MTVVVLMVAGVREGLKSSTGTDMAGSSVEKHLKTGQGLPAKLVYL